jgi:hypothetical protein
MIHTYIIRAFDQNETRGCENVRSEKLMLIVLRDRVARNMPK